MTITPADDLLKLTADIISAQVLADRCREAGAQLLAIPSMACLTEGMGATWPDAIHEVVRLYDVAGCHHPHGRGTRI